MKPLALLLSLVLILTALAACSAGPLPPPIPQPAPPTVEPLAPTAVPATPEAAPTVVPETPGAVPPAEDDWTSVSKAGVLLVGSPLDNPPFNTYDADFEPDGFDIALMDEIAAQLGLEVEYNDFAFDGLLGALQLGRVDAVIAAMAVTEDRQEVADFTTSYYQGEDILLAAAKSPITGIAGAANLGQYKIGVQRGTVYESWLLKNLVEPGKMPAANLRAFSQPADALTALELGRVDLVVMDREPGLTVVAEGRAKEVGKSLYTQDYAIAIRRG